MTRSVLLVVLPHRLATAPAVVTRKASRTYIASYLKRFATDLDRVEILDLEVPDDVHPDRTPEQALDQKLDEFGPDIVGFSMSYDVSYPWLKSLINVVRRFDEFRSTTPEVITIVASVGPGVTTAYKELLADCDLDACCYYAEGKFWLKKLVDADDMNEAPAKVSPS